MEIETEMGENETFDRKRALEVEEQEVRCGVWKMRNI